MITLIKSVVNLIYKAIMAVVNALTSFLIYFGLYIPFIYLIYTGLLMIFGGLNIKTSSMPTALFYIGLIISILCSLVITFKRLKGNDRRNDDYIDTRPPERRRNYNRYRERDYDSYDNRYNYHNRYDIPRYRDNPNYDVPIVHRHSRYPGIVMYEYSNRTEYYGDNGRKQLIYLKTTYKR